MTVNERPAPDWQSRDRDEKAPKKPPMMAYLSSGLGALLFVLSVAMLGYDGLKSTQGKPAIELTVQDVSKSGSSWLARIQARNTGEATAAAVTVEGRLMDGDTVVEESEAEFDYVPAGSVRQGGLFFRQDPSAHDLQLRVRGYVEP